jgi:hypothetical protein
VSNRLDSITIKPSGSEDNPVVENPLAGYYKLSDLNLSLKY